MMRNRRAIHLGCLLLAALLAGCSGLRLAYRQADTLLTWRADTYFDFSAAQKQNFRVRLERLLAWHRYDQLPDYAAFLTAAIAKARPGLRHDDIEWFADGIKARYRVVADRGAPDAAQLLAALTADNIAALQKRLAKDNEKFVKEHAVGGPPEARRRARLKLTLERIEDWTGHLGYDQEQRVAALLDAVPYTDDAHYQDRLRRQKEFIDLLAARANADFPARVHAWLADYEHERTPEYARLAHEAFEKNIEFYVAVDRLLTPTQRLAALARLQQFADDCITLSQRKTGAADGTVLLPEIRLLAIVD